MGDRQDVVVDGRDFGPHDNLGIDECVAGGPCNTLDGTTADSAGRFLQPVPVHRLLADGFNIVDCATNGVVCEIVVRDFDEPNVALDRTISFDARLPAPPSPTVVVDPSSGLADGDTVAVTASGFAPGETVASGQCQANATTTNGCDGGTAVFGTANGAGQAVLQLVVHTTITTSAGPATCTDGCFVVALQADKVATAPISFGG